MRKQIGFLLVFLGLFLTVATSWQDSESYCVIFPQNGRDIFGVSQRNILIFSENEVALIPQVHFEGNARDFGIVVPVPAEPTLSTAGANVFNEASFMTQPLIRTSDSGCNCEDQATNTVPFLARAEFDASAMLDDKSGGVTIVYEQTVGMFQAVVLQATNGSELTDWLDLNGYNYDQKDSETLDSYVSKNWYFVAMKLDTAQVSQHVDRWWNATTSPAQIRFSDFGSSLTYRLKMSASSRREHVDVVLYTIDTDEFEALAQSYPQFSSLISQNSFVTKLRKTFSEAEMKNDIEITVSEDRREFREVRYRSSQNGFIFASLSIFALGILMSRKKKVKTAESLLLVCLLSLNFNACSKDPASPVIRELTQLEKNIVESDNRFGLKLFQRMVDNSGQHENVMISPLSVSMALGMTLNGAANSTYEEIVETLEFTGLSSEEINSAYQSLTRLLYQMDPAIIFEIANSIWYREGLDIAPDFVSTSKKYFDAEVRDLDFAAAGAKDVINNWVKDETHGRIQEIVKEISPAHVMFLINTIYFKGDWVKQFDKELTVDDLFFGEDGSSKSVKMMWQEENHPYFENEFFQAVDLPYGETGFAMMILLPKNNVSLASVVNHLTNENWQALSDSLRENLVNLSLPRFKIEYGAPLKDILSEMGMASAFLPGVADLSRLVTTNRALNIDKIQHKTFIEVNEEGAEAAAVTSVEIVETSLPFSIPMIVNHPFVFAIHDNHSETILFIGKVADLGE